MAFVSLFTLASATQAIAAGGGGLCGGGTYTNNSASGGRTVTQAAGYPAGYGFNVTVDTPANFQSLQIRVGAQIVCNSVASCSGANYTAQVDNLNTTLTITSTRPIGAPSAAVTLTCFNSAPVTTTTTTSSGGPTSASAAAGGTGSASSSAIGSAIGSAFGARGGGGATVSQNGIFLSTTASTQGVSGALSGATLGNAWVSVQGTSFSGNLDGNGAEVTLGADYETGPGNLVGAILSYGSYKVTSGGVTYDTRSLSFGPYVSFGITERYRLDAYAVLARPNYEAGAVSYSSNRVAFGLAASAEYALGRINTTSSLGVRGFSEGLPAAAPGGARTVSSYTASIATRFDFQAQGAARPWLALGADATRFQDGATKLESISPSIGVGVDVTGAMGNLSLSLNNAQVFDGARATTLGVNWTMTF